MNRKKIWLAATALLLIPGIHFWASPAAPPLQRPETPIDRVNAQSAQHWKFVNGAARLVPPGASYTITAANTEEEMSLFMMSLGAVRHGRGEPSSYYSRAIPQIGRRAEYVLAYGCTPQKGAVELVSFVPGGCVYRRQGQ